jgi:hypothetical protein
MLALWPMGRYGDIVGQNHKILLKNRQILKHMYSYDKYHRLSFLMSQTWFVYSVGHFGTKTTGIGRKSVKLLRVNISLLND